MPSHALAQRVSQKALVWTPPQVHLLAEAGCQMLARPRDVAACQSGFKSLQVAALKANLNIGGKLFGEPHLGTDHSVVPVAVAAFRHVWDRRA